MMQTRLSLVKRPDIADVGLLIGAICLFDLISKWNKTPIALTLNDSLFSVKFVPAFVLFFVFLSGRVSVFCAPRGFRLTTSAKTAWHLVHLVGLAFGFYFGADWLSFVSDAGALVICGVIVQCRTAARGWRKIKLAYVIDAGSERDMTVVSSSSTVSHVLEIISVARACEFVRLCLDGSNCGGSDEIADYFREGAVFSVTSRAWTADLFRQAAELGNVEAKGEYARCLIDGDGVKIDRSEKAYKIGAEAAEAGDPLGQAVCGLCCSGGWGCAKDLSRAYQLARASADADNAYGIYVLGRCLDEGWGCMKDVMRAV
jgi:hypothetical protein